MLHGTSRYEYHYGTVWCTVHTQYNTSCIMSEVSLWKYKGNEGDNNADIWKWCGIMNTFASEEPLPDHPEIVFDDLGGLLSILWQNEHVDRSSPLHPPATKEMPQIGIRRRRKGGNGKRRTRVHASQTALNTQKRVSVTCTIHQNWSNMHRSIVHTDNPETSNLNETFNEMLANYLSVCT